MPEDFYGQDEEAAPSSAQTPPEPDKSDEKQDEGGETALIPKSLLAGKEFKPGEEVMLKIVHIYEDEVEVKYASEKSADEKPKSQMDQSDGALEKMAKPMTGY